MKKKVATKNLSASGSTSTNTNSIPLSIKGRPSIAFTLDDAGKLLVASVFSQSRISITPSRIIFSFGFTVTPSKRLGWIQDPVFFLLLKLVRQNVTAIVSLHWRLCSVVVQMMSITSFPKWPVVTSSITNWTPFTPG